jgi:hypothetical protein
MNTTLTRITVSALEQLLLAGVAGVSADIRLKGGLHVK